MQPTGTHAQMMSKSVDTLAEMDCGDADQTQDGWWEGKMVVVGYLNPIHCIMDDSGLCLLQSDRGGGGRKT